MLDLIVFGSAGGVGQTEYSESALATDVPSSTMLLECVALASFHASTCVLWSPISAILSPAIRVLLAARADCGRRCERRWICCFHASASAEND